MTIRQLDPADAAAMEQSYQLAVAVTQYDVPDFPTPSRQDHLARFEDPLAAALLAWEGGRVVGAASYQLPQSENLMYLDLVVHPQYRCRGIGTRLLEEVYAVARQHERGLIEVEAVRALPGGVARDEAGYRYLTNRSHRPGATSIRSRCQIADHAGGDAATLADGYSSPRCRAG